MKSYLRIHSPWTQLIIFLLFLLVGVLVASAAGAGILLAKGYVSPNQKDIDFSNPKVIDLLKSIQLLYTIMAFFLPALVFAWMTYKYKQLYFLGFRSSPKFNYYILAVLLMAASFPLASWLGELNERIPLAQWMIDAQKEASKQMESFLKTSSTKEVVLNLLIICFIPAICEEVCFRGVLQRIFINICKSPWTGIIIGSIFFSAFHMEFEGFLPRMFLGIVLGALYWYSGSLWVSITAHFFNNASQLILIMRFPNAVNENSSVPFYAAIASALIAWGILLLVKRQSVSTYRSAYEPDEPV
jgi:membrane protease YdiL (CAAX protease family)